jgi:uncharacterized protein
MKPLPRSVRRWKSIGGLVGGVLLLLSAAGIAAGPQQFPPITSVPGSSRLPGKFVWADLVTDDVAAARKFYGRLFGWQFQETGGCYIAMHDERPLCGMFQRERPADRPAAKPRWISYLSVTSVDRAQSAVLKAHGTVLAPPREMPGRGEQAIFADAEGAVFGVIRSSAGDPEDFLPDPGEWVWIELLSRDAKSAADFYHRVGGYDVVENTATNRLNDYVLASKGYARAVIGTIPSGNERLRPTWLPFVRVGSIRDSLALAQQLGGKVLIEPKPELFQGRVAVIADPTGAAIGVLEWDDQLVKGGG